MPLLCSNKIIKAHAIIQDGVQVRSVHRDKRSRFFICFFERSSKAVDADEQADSIPALASNLGCEDVSVAPVCWCGAPARLDYVIIRVEGERTVYLLKRSYVREAWLKVVEKKQVCEQTIQIRSRAYERLSLFAGQ